MRAPSRYSLIEVAGVKRVSEIRGGKAAPRVLIAEDMLIEALALAQIVRGLSCEPVGPVARTDELRRLARQERVDAAILDVNLGGDLVFEAAEQLAARDIPLLFVTGYDPARFPERFKGSPRLEKPYVLRELEAGILELVGWRCATDAAPGRGKRACRTTITRSR